MVYCCQTYEEVKEGDYGCVVRLDQDGLQDLNVQATWFSKGGTYWVSCWKDAALFFLNCIILLLSFSNMNDYSTFKN